MSTEEEEEKRLNQCIRKYQIMIKQIDELVEMMDHVRTRPPKRRRSTRGNNSSNDPAVSANQPDDREVIVQIITRFLHELKSNPATDPKCSTSTRGRG
ncbi:hypothetical protein EPI10_018198 [Gossypium australe]|uniref:Uncharacterized protein n=1 Tax=Gossypium australe TaxID=47621 RepID=A0A5B6UB68_9ROSI|nr:hypothetical protein EPI10_018198 [Gossypium australe]